MIMLNNNLLPQIAFVTVLLITVLSRRLHCEAYTLKSNDANSLPLHSNPKSVLNNAIPKVYTKLPAALPPSILTDYYNSLTSNSGQYLHRPPFNNWPQTEFIPLSNVAEDEYDNGDEYYDDNSDQMRSGPSDIYYANDAYQPKGWFNGPVIYDTPDSNAQNDENDIQLDNIMMTYLLDQFDKLNKQKELSEKKVEPKSQNPEKVTTSLPAVTPLPSTLATITTHAIPKKLTSKQFRLFQRGQKEFPLLRPASDNDDKDSGNAAPEWPAELDEKKLSEEDSLMSLKQMGQLRTVRDVLTAQLDNLKKEGPKLH